MNNYKTAFFVMNPTSVEELKESHTKPEETPYVVVKEVTISSEEFKDFTSNFKVDRDFLKDNSSICEEGYIMYCLCVHCSDMQEKILVVADVGKSAMVKWAAYIE